MRLVARKVKIEDITNGSYVRGVEGEPSRVVTPWGEELTSARVMATVVEKFLREDQGYCVVSIDDGTGIVRLKAWREGVPVLADLKVGDLVDVLGRVREYGGEVYLVPDVVIKVRDPNWELVRELEILRARRRFLGEGRRPQPRPPRFEAGELEVPTGVPQEPKTGEFVEEEPLPEVPDEVKKKTMLALDKLDKGEGVSLADIAVEINLPLQSVEDAARVLVVEGEIFEPAVGRFKRVW